MLQQTQKPSPLKNKNITAFSQQPGKADGKQQKAREHNKMVEAGKDRTGEPKIPMKADIWAIAGKLETLEMRLQAKFAEFYPFSFIRTIEC